MKKGIINKKIIVYVKRCPIVARLIPIIIITGIVLYIKEEEFY